MFRTPVASSLLALAAFTSPALAQDTPTLLDRLAVNGVTFSGTSLDSDATVDVGDGQDLQLFTDGSAQLVDRESGDVLLSGILTFDSVDTDQISAIFANATHLFKVNIEPSSITNSGVTIDGTVSSGGAEHMFAPLWIEDTADNIDLLLAQDPVPLPLPVEPPRRGKYACICAWTQEDGTTGYRIGCAKADCNIQTTCSSTPPTPTPTPTPTPAPAPGTKPAQAARAAAAAAITGRCMWVDSSDPNGATSPAILIGALSSVTVAGFAGLALFRRRRAAGV